MVIFRWRSFNSDRKAMATENFIDGDFVERFLELPENLQNEVLNGTKPGSKKISASIIDVVSFLEDISRLH